MNIVIVGAGSFGTALGNVLIKKDDLSVLLLARNKETEHAINKKHFNDRYFPNFRLDNRLRVSTDKSVLQKANTVFLALPSTSVIEYVQQNKKYMDNEAVMVVLSKGFGKNNKTIVDSLREIVSNPICSLKGPTFAADLIHNNPSAFTAASAEESVIDSMRRIFKGTAMYLDYSNDIVGVEIASALKNIYAILLGIIDAHFNSANVRFLILTKAFHEMKNIVLLFGGSEETLYKYCGFGDFNLTALNDLSRNRTLGLLIGKGFLNNDTSNSIILEGIRTINIVFNSRCIQNTTESAFPMLGALYRLFNSDYSIHAFISDVFDSIKGS